jgi:hypothetical protein
MCAPPTREDRYPRTPYLGSLHDCWWEGRFTGTIRERWSEALCSLAAINGSRFRNCVFAERNRIGGAHKKRGSQRPRKTLRREIHAAQEVLEARVGAEGIVLRLRLQQEHPPLVLLIRLVEQREGLLFIAQSYVNNRPI